MADDSLPVIDVEEMPTIDLEESSRPDYSLNPPPVPRPSPEDASKTPSFSTLQSSPSLGAMGGMLTRPVDPEAIGQVAKAEAKGIGYGVSALAPIASGGASIPIQMLVNSASGATQSALMGGNKEQIATSGVLGGLIGGASGMIPRASNAVAIFKRLANIAPESSVPLRNSVNPLVDILKEASSGGQKPKVVTDLLKRVNQGGPLTYDEARTFYKNVSSLSADEANRLTPNMKRLLGNLREAMHNDILANRTAFGVGEDYNQAVQTYGAAKSFERTAGTAAKVTGGAVGASVLGGLGWKIAQALSGSHRR